MWCHALSDYNDCDRLSRAVLFCRASSLRNQAKAEGEFAMKRNSTTRNDGSREDKKLKLRKQTIRSLDSNELAKVVGGTWGGTGTIATVHGD
jgi:hypothetical protein